MTPGIILQVRQLLFRCATSYIKVRDGHFDHFL